MQIKSAIDDLHNARNKSMYLINGSERAFF